MRFLLTERKINVLYVFILTGTFVFSTVHFSLAQSPVFTASADNVVLLNSIFLKLEKQYQQEIAALPSENKKDFAEVYKLRWDNIKEIFDKKEIYTSAAAQQYLDALTAEIVKANPLLQKQDIHCYFSRSGVPNASYIGEGIILFNMGLFQRLDNESQAAFVLCHELSHYILHHSENSISTYVTALNSKDVQQGLRKIKSSEFKKREELEKLLKGLTFDTRRHSRDHESEADSMAAEFMHNTRYNTGEALTTLALLDSIDTDTLKTDVCLEKMFNQKDYPFQKKWIAKEEGLLGGHARLDDDEPLADSLKTHPDCKLRITILESLIKKYSSSSTAKDVVDSVRFNDLRNTFKYEIIEYAFKTDNYTRSLYHTLELLESRPSDPYLVAQVGKIFNGLYAAQKNHTVSKVVSLPAPFYPSNYNLLLQFIQNLYKEDFASISYHYLNQYHPQLDYYPSFKREYNTSIQIATQ